jgi:hypothetical protein
MILNRRESEAARRLAPRGTGPSTWPEPLIRCLRSLEAENPTFDSAAVLCILDGEPGPWLKPGVPGVSLFAAECFVSLLEELRGHDSSGGRTRCVRQLHYMKQLIERTPMRQEYRRDLLATLALARADVPPRLRTGPLHPQIARQGQFMDPLVVHLVEYAVDNAPLSLARTFTIVDEILSLASEGRYSGSPGSVRMRYYRWVYRTHR